MKLSSINISKFRGIPSDLNLDFTNIAGEAVSIIIFGDNGSGKSSIVDAIEFGLQSRIERSVSINNPTRPTVFNQSINNKSKASVRIKFNNDTEIYREAKTEYDEKHKRIKFVVFPKAPHPEFSICPVILRRNDILSYTTATELQKQVYLMKCIYNLGSNVRVDSDPEIIKMQENYAFLKQKRREIMQEIAFIMDVNLEEIQKRTNELEGYVRNRIKPFSDRRYYNKKKNQFIKRVPLKVYNRLIDLVEKFKEYTTEIKNIQSAIKTLTNSSNENESKFISLKKLLLEAEKYLYNAFTQVSNVDYVNNIELEIGHKSDVSLEIVIELNTGHRTSPQRIFSEANYDLIILLLHISLFRACSVSRQGKVLILDDILQSVDAVIRVRFMEYILKELPDWQIIITCHDRLWLNQLKYIFHRFSHKYKEFHISRWNFFSGPTIISQNNEKKDDMITKAIQTNNPRLVAAACGVILEMICQKLSTSLNTTIKRKIDDKYTIGDLWPGIKKVLKKSILSKIVENIDSLLLIRNILGCHYNEWAESLSNDEILFFAKNIQDLYDNVFCEKCGCWLTNSLDSSIIAECKCKSIIVAKA